MMTGNAFLIPNPGHPYLLIKESSIMVLYAFFKTFFPLLECVVGTIFYDLFQFS